MYQWSVQEPLSPRLATGYSPVDHWCSLSVLFLFSLAPNFGVFNNNNNNNNNDIGWRVVWQRISLGLSFRHIAAQLQISLGTAYKLYARFEETRDVAPKKQGPRRDSGKLDEFHETYIICLLAENPSLYLSELCQRIHDSTGTTVSGSTVCRLLKRNNITRKNLFTLLDKDV